MEEIFVGQAGRRLWTIRQGSGVPVMLCNGGPGCADYLQPVADMLVDRAMVLRFEQRGCGRSDAAPSYDVKTCLDDLEQIRQHYGLERWIIGGHSWGADLALLYALEYPEQTAGLICLAGGRVHNDREWHAEYHRQKDTKGEILPPMPYPPNMEVNAQVHRDWKQMIQQPLLFRRIAQSTVPALFIYGAQDIRPAWAVEQVARLMTNARFILLDAAPHVLWHTHPEQLRDHLRDFIAPAR